MIDGHDGLLSVTTDSCCCSTLHSRLPRITSIDEKRVGLASRSPYDPSSPDFFAVHCVPSEHVHLLILRAGSAPPRQLWSTMELWVQCGELGVFIQRGARRLQLGPPAPAAPSLDNIYEDTVTLDYSPSCLLLKATT